MRLAPQGFFGYERFGYGFFGVASTPVLFSGTIVSSGLVAALSQETPNAQQIGTTVTIGGVDYSAYVESVLVQIKEDTISPAATLNLVGSFALAIGAALVIQTKYSFADGTSFTATLFSGVIRSSQPTSGSQNKTTVVYGYDAASDFLSAAPDNTTWTGTAYDLITAELSDFDTIVLDFADYTIPAGLSLSEFTSKRDLILAVAGGREEVVLYIDQAGTVYVRNYATGIGSGQTLDTRGVTYYQAYDNASDRYASVTIQAPDGTTGTATSELGKTAFFGTGKFCVTEADCEAKAGEILARSLLTTYSVQVPLNPVVQIGGNLVLNDLVPAQIFAGKITGISHSIQWTGKSSPGAWTNLTVRSAE